ncbi:uncharacterized protein ZBAI_09830 [Zygosaccharomyces bailii ISA1307]|nr:uncharacterized protein ZBAI_09830 [Zygosaccharomyces bailii ISA1307]
MSSFRRTNEEHFWRRCCRKLIEIGDESSRTGERHHSFRRWKNVHHTHLNTCTSETPKQGTALTQNPKEQTLYEIQEWQQPGQPAQQLQFRKSKRTVSGAATAPPLNSGVNSTATLSPLTFVTAETTPTGKTIGCSLNEDEPRPTLDPRNSCSFRSSIKSARFQKSEPHQRKAEPSVSFGIAVGGSSAASSFLNNSSEEDSTMTCESTVSGRGHEGNVARSPSFDHIVNSFDWYTTGVFKKLETSVLSLLNLREYCASENSENSSSPMTMSLFNEFYGESSTPCTGAASKQEQEIDEEIYGHHAKCFI